MKQEQPKIIVSITSFPAAIQYAIPAVQSILDGSVKPYKIVLYLTASQFPDRKIPNELQEMQDKNPIFEVRFYDEAIRSYTKLIPALKDFPNDIIVTVDDDLYHKNMLQNLLCVHKRYPNAIIGHNVKRLKFGIPYRKWKKYRWYSFFTSNTRPKFGNAQAGCGGVLYPSKSLKGEMLDPKLFTEIAPTVDDIWFWAAAVANGTKIAPVTLGRCKQRGLGKPLEITLMSINTKSGVDINRIALEKIIEKYPIVGQRIGL